MMMMMMMIMMTVPTVKIYQFQKFKMAAAAIFLNLKKTPYLSNGLSVLNGI